MTPEAFERAIGPDCTAALDELARLGEAIRAEIDGIGHEGAATARLRTLKQEETLARTRLALALADRRAGLRSDAGAPGVPPDA